MTHPAGLRAPRTGTLPAVSWDSARSTAHGAVLMLPPVSVPLADAQGGVLVEAVRATTAVPGADCAAMDGYAVCGAPPWSVVSRLLAGGGVPAPLAPGTACELVTGAPVPMGTSSVLPYEHAHRVDELVHGAALPGRHVRRAGEECAAGEEVLAAGAVLTPAALGLAAALGHDRLLVRPPPGVRALITGDELLEAGPPREGRVRDAIGPMLPGLVAWAGGRFDGGVQLADSVGLLVAAIRAADSELVLVSGSSSRGPADHLRPALKDLAAEMIVDGVACRPGHPQAMARLPDGRYVIGLPGNPLAAVVAFLTLVLPAMSGLRGLPLADLPPVDNQPAVGPPADHGTRLVPVRVRGGIVTKLSHAGSAMLRGLAVADALAVVDPSGAIRLHSLPGSH